jgi:6-phosphogluconolactonase
MEASKRSRSARRRAAILAPAVAVAAAALLAPSVAGAQVSVKVGSMYTQTNGNPNRVVAFDRFSDGTLSQAQSVLTGGIGEPATACNQPAPADPSNCPITDSQGSVAINPTGTLVFATNAGDDSLSSFAASATGGLHLVSHVKTGGFYPQSVTTHGNVLYVLNQESGTIAGFHFTSAGVLTPIAGSVQHLATPTSHGNAAEVSFDRTGRTLTVTERDANLIDVFPVTDGVAGPGVANPSVANGPFGFAYDALGHLVVSDALSQQTGATSTYQQTSGLGLAPIDTEDSGGGAPCWVVIPPDNKFAYVSNTTTKSIARYALGTDGSLTLLGTTPISNVPPPPGPGIAPVQFPTDEALSRDGRFFYVIVPSVFGPPISRVDAFAVNSVTGDLTFLSSTPQTLAPGLSGLAGR